MRQLQLHLGLNEEEVMVKAQVHAGGRGKSGGIKKCSGQDEVVETVEKMIGMKLKTPQTGDKQKTVSRVYIEKAHNIETELYFCILVDRETGGNTIITSKKVVWILRKSQKMILIVFLR